MKEEIKVLFFDGKSAKSKDVTIKFIDSKLILNINNLEETFETKDYKILLPVGKTNFKITLKDRGKLFFDYNEELYLELSKSQSTLINFITLTESNLKYLYSLLITSITTLLILYFYGLPLFVSITKPLVSENIKELIGNNVIKILDKALVDKSKLSIEKQKEILQAFNNFKSKTNYKNEVKVYFRDGASFGANAFAVLPNKIILTDQLVKKLTIDELVAVSAHELAHLSEDHGTEGLLRHSILAGLSLLIVGGDPGTIQALALNVVETGYSRDQEKEADIIGIKYLKSADMDKNLLANALKKLFSDFESEDESFAEKYLSTHPGGTERIDYIKNSN